MSYDRKTIDRFKDLIPRLDNAGQVISAEDINVLQELIEALEREAFKQQDEDFLQMASEALEQHPDLNAMWVELLHDDQMINMNNSLGIVYSQDEYGVCLDSGSSSGYMTSKRFTPQSGCNIKKVLLFARYQCPEKDELVLEVSNNGLDFTEITPNSGQVVVLQTDGSALYLRARFRREPDSDGPRLDAWAVLYYDSTLAPNLDERLEPDLDFEDPGLPPPPPPPQMEIELYHSELLGIGPDDHHPKIHRHSGEPGENDKIDLTSEVKNVLWWEYLPPELTPFEGYVAIVRDPNQDDRVVRVEAENSTFNLIFDGDRLVEAVTAHLRDGVEVTRTVTTLDWQPYTYADGTTEDTVVGVNIARTEV